jgi:hypothetical protein
LKYPIVIYGGQVYDPEVMAAQEFNCRRPEKR